MICFEEKELPILQQAFFTRNILERMASKNEMLNDLLRDIDKGLYEMLEKNKKEGVNTDEFIEVLKKPFVS